ncbi:hypothetical protein B296_00056449, partial [Ensete ventricosum]
MFYWYADRPLPGGAAKIDRRRSIEGEKGKKKKRKRRKKKKRRKRPFPAPSSLVRRRRPRAIFACGRLFSRARRQNVSLRGEKDRSD